MWCLPIFPLQPQTNGRTLQDSQNGRTVNIWNGHYWVQSYSAMNQSKSCSLWTKCFIFFACMTFSNGCVDSAWRKTSSKSHGSSVKHVLFTQTDSQPAFTSQARPTLPRIQNKCTFQDFSLFNSGFPLTPPTPSSFPSLFCPFALRLERIRCSQKTKLGTSRFKCCLGWFLFTSMVRGFHLTPFLCVLLFLSCSSVRKVAWPTA